MLKMGQVMEEMVEWHREGYVDPAIWEKLIPDKVDPALMPAPSVLQSLPALPPQPGGSRQAQSALEYHSQVGESFSCLT